MFLSNLGKVTGPSLRLWKYHRRSARQIGMAPSISEVTGTRFITCNLVDIYIYMVPPPPQDPYFLRIYWYLRYFVVFLLCLNVCFFWRLFYMFKKLCRVVKTLPPLIKLFSFNRKGFLQNLEKTKKPKNQNFLEKFWFQVKRCFFLVFLEFFFVFFGLDS